MFSKFKEALTHKGEQQAIRRSYMVFLTGAITALIAAFTLTIEKLRLLQDPDALLSCSFNVVLNCSTVMQTWQSSVFFGIPNMYIGLIAFPVLVTVAVGYLWGGARYNKGFMKTMSIGVLLGTGFSYWLFFESMYAIQILCPWCLVVTLSCTLMLAAVTHITLHENSWNFSKKTHEKITKFLKAGYHQVIVASWIVLMTILIFIQFGAALFA